MKKALLKDSLKEIKNTYKRFISILLMAFLGVGFFAGIRATSPDMIDTIDKYFNEQNVYDIKILSTLGLTDEDIDVLSKIENVEKVYGEYSEDILLNYEDTDIVTKILSIDNVNKIQLIEGKMPENINECLVEKSFCNQTGKKIGDTLTINEDENSIIKEKEIIIVGTMNSPLYTSRERDTSNLGSGRVSYNIYLPKENFNSEVYTEIYITLQNTKKLITDSEKYKNHVEEVKNNIEKIKEERQNARYDEIVNKATQELNDAKDTLETQKEETQTKIQNAESEINKNEQNLQTAQITLNNQKQQAQEKFKLVEKELQVAKNQIEEQENNLPIQEQQSNAKIKELEIQKTQLQKQYNQIEESLKNTSLTQQEIEVLNLQKITIVDSIEKTNIGIDTIKTQIEQGKIKIQQAKQTINNQEQEFNKTKESTEIQLKNAQVKINNLKQELENAKTTLQTNKNEYEEKIKDAEREIADAENKIKEIENPTWYILDRKSNTGYNSFMQDTKSIENIGKVFPIVFFIVATLISLTSMTRMVEEQRVQIGTLKSLGYNKIQISRKYILYASLACIIGGIIGMLIGFVLLPKVIWLMYSMMYVMPSISISFNWYYALLGLGLASICIVGATIYTLLNTLKETPSELMRPKSPKPGKRVLLEKNPFIWKRLNFSNKVTVRNIFRYKKRFLMTIIGIAGCTALILAGFGIKDSISEILPSQYENVYNYDMQLTLKSKIEENKLQDFINQLKEREEIDNIVETYMTSATLKNKDKEETVQVIVPKNEKIEEVIKIADAKTKEKIELQEGKIAITDKVAQLLEVKKGDIITLKDSENVEKQIEISDVVENYIYHYVYMPKELYEELYKNYETNVLFIQNNNVDNQQEEVLSKELLQQDIANSVLLNSNTKNIMDDMMSSLNYVVIILIVSAGLLAFVVLYNLSNINISERIRELATIKVLGFYDKEVYKYVTRETVILTAIGIILGLLCGYLLNIFIIGTCEINVLRFIKQIKPISYIYAIIITVIFTIIVNIFTYFSLKKINMIESLKSVE